MKVYGVHADGGFCEYFVADECKFHKIPDSLSFPQAVMIEPYTIAAQSTWRGNVQKDDFVLIHGAGPIGLVIADMAKSMGAVTIVSEVNEYRLGLAGDIGADYTINPVKENLKDRLNEITNDMGPNVIFEATGVPALFTEAVELVSEAGRIVPLAFISDPTPINIALVCKKEIGILGTRLQTFKFASVIEKFEQYLGCADRLITGVYPAEQFQQVFNELTDPKSTHCKVILTF